MELYPPNYNPAVFESVLSSPHILIAGATGSGKSVLINGLICTDLRAPSPRPSLVLIDPKKVELYAYKDAPTTLRYTDDAEEAAAVLDDCVRMMMHRFDILRRKGLKKWDGNEIHIYIDEFAALVDLNKAVNEPLSQIAILGRASGIKAILATQRPTRDVLNGCIAVNIDSRVALKTATAQDSRNIIGIRGAENISIGQGLYRHGAEIEYINIPFITDADTAAALYYSKHVLLAK